MENKKCWHCGEIIFNATSKYRAEDGKWRLKFRVECLECGLCGPYAEDENEAWERWEEMFRKEDKGKQTREFRLLTERCLSPLPVCERFAEEEGFRIHCLACDRYGPIGTSPATAWEGWKAFPEKGEKDKLSMIERRERRENALKHMSEKIRVLERENEQLKNIHNIAGKLVDTTNLLSEIDDRLGVLREYSEDGAFYTPENAAARDALESLRDWVLEVLE